MPEIYGRDLDLNLLRVFAVVAESGSVTEAAKRLYLTQPAVSAALRRLQTSVGAPLFARSGRGLSLTSRGSRLHHSLHPHLERLVEAALAPPIFDPRTNNRSIRIGLSDSAEQWLLPQLMHILEREAPRMRIIALPVQFRTVAAALANGLDIAVTVADELPAMTRRQRLITTGFTCLYDPRHARFRTLTEKEYFAREHVIVSYNGDLRGIVEDFLGKARTIRCSVSSFTSIGALIDGSSMLATVPEFVADQILTTRPHLATKPLPFDLAGSYAELLWPAATDDDEPCRFVRSHIVAIANRRAGKKRKRSRRSH